MSTTAIILYLLAHHVCGAGDAEGLTELENLAGGVRGQPRLKCDHGLY